MDVVFALVSKIHFKKIDSQSKVKIFLKACYIYECQLGIYNLSFSGILFQRYVSIHPQVDQRMQSPVIRAFVIYIIVSKIPINQPNPDFLFTKDKTIQAGNLKYTPHQFKTISKSSKHFPFFSNFSLPVVIGPAYEIRLILLPVRIRKRQQLRPSRNPSEPWQEKLPISNVFDGQVSIQDLAAALTTASDVWESFFLCVPNPPVIFQDAIPFRLVRSLLFLLELVSFS